MLQKIKNVILAAILPLAFATPIALTLSPNYAYACTPTTIRQGINEGINSATQDSDSCDSTGANGTPTLQDLASKVVNFLSVIVGVVAVIMIIVGGFRYITSGGESSNVSGAKNTLIYAIVGLVIVALAQFIVHFVLNNVTGS